IRRFPGTGTAIWGARTLEGDDRMASEWKYVPVRRLALFIEESVDRGTEWAVFEPNDERLWAKIRQCVGDFLHKLWQGAFQSQVPAKAFFVRCDRTTMTQDDINAGRLSIDIGFRTVAAGRVCTPLDSQDDSRMR